MDFLLQNFGKIVLSVIGALLLLLVVRKFAKIKAFLVEVKVELSKVSWSSREELIGSTVVVFGITGMLAVFIGLVDLLLSHLLRLLFK